MHDGTEGDKHWNEVFDLRNAEQREARNEFESFLALVSGRRSECLLTGVFKIIEPEAWGIDDCGRCEACWQRNVGPPVAPNPKGLDQVWPGAISLRQLPRGRILVEPDDPYFDRGLAHLLTRLARVGIEQVVVPDGCGDYAAKVLEKEATEYGLVIEFEDFLRANRRLCDLPTAVLMPIHGDDAAHCFERTTEFITQNPKQSLFLIASGDRLIAGRRLSQVASQIGAYREAALDDLTIRGGGRQT
jgi:hypothetical protein